MTKAQEGRMEVAEMKLLRFSLELTRVNRVQNEEIRRIVRTRRLGEVAREQRL